jgi:hypothetical protein
MRISKEHILSEIRRTAAQNNVHALGVERFAREAGIKESDWRGIHWARWGDALREAGFDPNQWNPARSKEDLLTRLAAVVRELGRFPSTSELKLRTRRDHEFPNPKTFAAHFGSKATQVQELRRFCEENGMADVVALLDPIVPTQPPAPKKDDSKESDFYFVYLLKSGRFYKIGCTNAVGRRERELAIQMPEKASVVHSIKTDDPRASSGTGNGGSKRAGRTANGST